MAIFLGNKEVVEIGNISEIYLGSTLVFPVNVSEDPNDVYLKYYIYTTSRANKTVTITGIYYDLWFEDFGNYDVIIPNTLKGMKVLLEA